MRTVTITIRGEPGSGKTTIAAALHALLVENGFTDVRWIDPDVPEQIGKLYRPDHPKVDADAIERLNRLDPKPRVELLEDSAEHAIGDRFRIVSGPHAGRIGRIIETELGDLVLSVSSITESVRRDGFVAGIDDFELERA